MNQKTFCFIFARGGSKGIPKKNILPIAGLPLLVHSINLAKSMKEVERIFVSTDCEKISKTALLQEVEVIKRPADLAQDDSSEWLAWQHAIRWLEDSGEVVEYACCIYATAPMIQVSDLIKGFDLLRRDEKIPKV